MGENIKFEKFYLLGYNAMQISSTCLHAGFLLGLFFDPIDGGDIFLRNVG
jgi:hypothetical protein